jgi:hypothetical protein
MELPIEEISEPQLQHFFFVETAEAPAALIGAEIDGEYTLPRSFAVDAGQRKAGLESLLVARLEYHTRERGSAAEFSADDQLHRVQIDAMLQCVLQSRLQPQFRFRFRH